MKRHERCSHKWEVSGPSVKYHYFHRVFTDSVRRRAILLRITFLALSGLASASLRSAPRTVSGGEFDWGGTSVKRQRRCPKASSSRTETSSRVKGQKLAWSWFSVRIRTAKAGPIDPFDFYEFYARGVRKVTTGITGLWRPSVHSDVAFWSFDVGSSYHHEAEFVKRWIVHPLTGNVSWV